VPLRRIPSPIARQGAPRQTAVAAHAASGPALRAKKMGNRQTGVMLREQGVGALIQLQPRAGRQSTTVPGLRQRTVVSIEQDLAKDPQAALNTLVAALAGNSTIDVTFLTDERMTAVADTSRMRPGHYGNTALSPGTGRPRPCRVDIGPDAFRSVGDLYATVMHEWQHVLQFRRTTSASEAVDELEARLWEVEHMRETGMAREAMYTSTLRTQLSIWWRRLTADEQSLFERRYRTALQMIEDAQLRQQTGRRR